VSSISPSEIFRKTIHLITSVIPLGYYLLIPDRSLVLIILSICSGLSIALEISRNSILGVQIIFDKFFKSLLRENESKGRITGATWLLISSFITIALYPIEIAVPSLIFLTIGDAFAAIIGQTFPFGRINGKTLGGSLGGLVLSLLVIIPTIQNINIGILILGGVSAMTVELLPIPINDNLTIPIISGSIMYAGVYLL